MWVCRLIPCIHISPGIAALCQIVSTEIQWKCS
uniref:Uncharacterized protein n=1 Tax=Rhizophora mucronata TaxID=61149 RepID=A0A2P2NK76_RHIMU